MTHEIVGDDYNDVRPHGSAWSQAKVYAHDAQCYQQQAEQQTSYRTHPSRFCEVLRSHEITSKSPMMSHSAGTKDTKVQNQIRALLNPSGPLHVPVMANK
ncbi:hypothetical protein HN011_000645 [Eciton burchellii]|nr:hypothetical protein HN011_000645 [Eciton burchellii]